MASEAEIERLYQLFVTNGGGALSFSGTNLTPKQYSDATAISKLTPIEMAQLEARQHQYNRQKALGVISDEIGNNTFSNPYAARGVYGNSLLSGLHGSAGSVAAGLINGGFSGFSDVNRALLVAGVLSQTGVDLEKIIKIAGLMTLGGAMYSSLTNHTNGQTANLPKTLEDASALSTMNEQFGEQGDPCGFFNQLMGILGGAFDGTLNFIETAIGDITSLLAKTGITAVLSSILSALTGAAGVVATGIAGVVALITGGIATILKTLSPLIGKVMSAMSDITSQIANEISSLTDMAAQLLKKAFALLIGSAGLDPCKRAVLDNTGSANMKDAIAQLNQPLGTAAPGGIGTTVDTRVNAGEVMMQLSQAQAEALLRAGVPQSPFTEAAKEYSTWDSALHSSATNSSIRPKGTPSDTTVPSTDAHGFNTSLLPVRRDGESMAEFVLRTQTESSISAGAPETSASSTTALESDAINPKLQVYSRNGEQMKRDWSSKQLSYVTTSQAMMSQMRNALTTKQFVGKASLSSRVTQLLDTQYANQQVVKNLTKKYMEQFYYWAEGGIPSRVTEKKIRFIYNTSIKPAQTRAYNNAVTSMADILIEWTSIDNQIY